eukprot:2398741-Lingulodinium_polyedra.AAC.1
MCSQVRHGRHLELPFEDLARRLVCQGSVTAAERSGRVDVFAHMCVEEPQPRDPLSQRCHCQALLCIFISLLLLLLMLRRKCGSSPLQACRSSVASNELGNGNLVELRPQPIEAGKGAGIRPANSDAICGSPLPAQQHQSNVQRNFIPPDDAR